MSDTTTYGTHLLLDGYGAPAPILSDVGRLFAFLDQLPARIGMQKIGPPQLARFEDGASAGVTGVVLIVTSHISLHTYTRQGCFFLDVFSCRPFDTADLTAHVRQVFAATRVEQRTLTRGRQFPVLALDHERSTAPCLYTPH